MSVTLNIDNQRIRLVSRRANRIEQWQTLELPAGVIKNGLILDPPAVANLLKERFQTLKLPVQNVRVCLTGLSFIYRVLNLPDLKTIQLKSAVERATQKEITLPLDNLYLDWQIINRSGGEQEVFVMGISRQMVDVLSATLKSAGISLQTLDLKALALARAAAHQNALMVDCEPDAFEILIVRQGVPVTIHRVNPKSEMSTLEDNLSQMMTELNRAIDYFNLNHPDDPLTQSVPVILCGSLCDDSRSRQLIVQGIGHAVEFMSSSLTLPANFPLSTFAANLALLNGPSTGGIDLIKARRRTLSHPLTMRTLVAAGALVAALALFALVWNLRQQAVDQSTDLLLKSDNLNQELLAASQELQQANQIQTRIAALTSEKDSIRSERELLAGKGDLASILLTVTGNLPPQATFTQIASQPDKITLDGTARYREDIMAYIHTLEKRGQFSEVRLSFLDAGSDPGSELITFRIIIER